MKDRHLQPKDVEISRRRSGELHRTLGNSHLQSENAETSRKNQMKFTEALKTATYKLRVQRQAEDQMNFTEALRTATLTS